MDPGGPITAHAGTWGWREPAKAFSESHLDCGPCMGTFLGMVAIGSNASKWEGKGLGRA